MRKIRLENQPGKVIALLEDCNHGFCSTIHHDGKKVTQIEAEHKRIPFTTCGGAKDPLQSLIGLEIGTKIDALLQQVDTRANCTHWLDLSLLAIRHAARDEAVREYVVEVPDEAEPPTTASIYRDGKLIHQWPVMDWVIQEPHEYAGNGIFKGFTKWACETFSDAEEREAAFALQKGYFVSRARRFDIKKLVGERANEHSMMIGACYTYSEPQANVAVRTEGTTRDFTHNRENLLKFLEI